MATSNFMSEAYNGRFAAEFSVLTLKEIMTLLRTYIYIYILYVMYIYYIYMYIYIIYIYICIYIYIYEIRK